MNSDWVEEDLREQVEKDWWSGELFMRGLIDGERLRGEG